MTEQPTGWFKSTHSGSDNCVEVLIDATGVRVRHSRHPAPVPHFNRCRVMINAEVSEDGPPLPDHVISGLCATLHKIATGAPPGHAPGEGG